MKTLSGCVKKYPKIGEVFYVFYAKIPYFYIKFTILLYVKNAKLLKIIFVYYYCNNNRVAYMHSK